MRAANDSCTGRIQLNEEEYSLNDEFKESSVQLADALNLDEIQSAKLLIESQDEAETLDRSLLPSAIIHFHEYRHFLLECLRIILKQYTDPESESNIREKTGHLILLILEIKDGPGRNGSLYAQKCLREMGNIEEWIQGLNERFHGALALGQTLTPEFDEIMGFQQLSLGQQHESLGAILTYLIKSNYTAIEDFYKLLEHLPKLDRWNNLAVHYVPVIVIFSSTYGSQDGACSLREARTLHSRIVDSKDSSPWILRNLQAATVTWWLAEYSGWYLEPHAGSPLQGVNLEAEALSRSNAFFKALADGAFQCTLSICSQIRPDGWYDPEKHGLIQFLLRDTPVLPAYESGLISAYFQDIVMEQFEAFSIALVCNLPDTLRRFKTEEDDQRKKIRSNLQSGMQNGISEHDLHLERFLIIVSFAFDGRVDASETFWSETDSNLYGFLQWASRRQSTPRASAFCGMLRAISKGDICATSAHRFLLGEGDATSSRIRRSSPLSWAQIFAEFDIYTSKIRNQTRPMRPGIQYGGISSSDEIDEPESDLMLECYLRLTAHLCCESTAARSWVLSHPTLKIIDVLLLLHSSRPSARVKACCFNVIRALLTDKTAEIGNLVWISLDQWLCNGSLLSLSISKSIKASNTPLWTEESGFQDVISDFNESSEFVGLLQSLVSPIAEGNGLNDALPFPEQLGSSYRMPGIDHYIDHILGQIWAKEAGSIEEPLQFRILAWNVLDFVATCLATFNEDLVILANKSAISVDAAMNTSSLSTYVRLHPFARVMEWMFNDDVLTALFQTAQQDVQEVSNASPESPLVLSLLRSIDVMNLIMEMQSTYLNIVRPLIKMQSSSRRKPVSTPSLASFEDSVENSLGLVVDLGSYAGAGIQELTVSSLRLLEKLASSRKLNLQTAPGPGQRLNSNRLIGVLEQHDDLEPIARSLTLAMHFDDREVMQGPLAPGWTIKSVILDFLNRCLAVSSGRPTLAHALLGFACTATTLDIETGGLFARGSSLFHAILHLVVDYPDGDGVSMQQWSLGLKEKGMQVLSLLWASPLTSVFTLTELRSHDFLFVLFLKQRTIEAGTEWDGRTMKDFDFVYTDSGITLENFLKLRLSLLEYTSTELHFVTTESAPALKARLLSTLLGTTLLPDGEPVQNLTIFDLLDFAEMELSLTAPFPDGNFLAGVDFSPGLRNTPDDAAEEYNLRMVEEIIALRLNELRSAGHFQDPIVEQQALIEAQTMILYLNSENTRHRISSTKAETLKAWAILTNLTIGHSDLDQPSKTALMMQAFQVITPKLERYAADNKFEAIYLARLVQALMFQFDFKSAAVDRSRSGDIANDRLFQIFRTALRAIHLPDMEIRLREVLYNICYRYLSGMTDVSNAPLRRRHSTQTVKGAGEKIIDIICDDAYAGMGTSKISALLLLDSLANVAKVERSSYVVDLLVRTNFILVLVETIKDIPQELRETDPGGRRFFCLNHSYYCTDPVPITDIPLLLFYYESKLSLLLTVSHSRIGANYVMTAGLFEVVRDSGLFSIDPDVGLGKLQNV